MMLFVVSTARSGQQAIFTALNWGTTPKDTALFRDHDRSVFEFRVYEYNDPGRPHVQRRNREPRPCTSKQCIGNEGWINIRVAYIV